jgi:thymidylate synthase (FAD)
MSRAALISVMGDDDTVVNAARVSFDREASQFAPEANERLIKYLARHGHWSPFSHPQVTFQVQAPIYVARQLAKHQVGLAWNEESRRYISTTPTFDMPKEWRGKPENSKQGSSGPLPIQGVAKAIAGEAVEIAYGAYIDLLALGVAPEQARMVLPQNMNTSWYWTGSLYAFARVCRDRLGADAQEETREVATEIAAHMQPLFPISWAALVGE